MANAGRFYRLGRRAGKWAACDEAVSFSGDSAFAQGRQRAGLHSSNRACGAAEFFNRGVPGKAEITLRTWRLDPAAEGNAAEVSASGRRCQPHAGDKGKPAGARPARGRHLLSS